MEKEIPSQEETDAHGVMNSPSEVSTKQQGPGGSGASLRLFREM